MTACDKNNSLYVIYCTELNHRKYHADYVRMSVSRMARNGFVKER